MSIAQDVSCRNCLLSSCPQARHACLDALSPGLVLEAAAELLALALPRPAPTRGSPCVCVGRRIHRSYAQTQ
jgi:hypothetical protein